MNESKRTVPTIFPNEYDPCDETTEGYRRLMASVYVAYRHMQFGDVLSMAMQSHRMMDAAKVMTGFIYNNAKLFAAMISPPIDPATPDFKPTYKVKHTHFKASQFFHHKPTPEGVQFDEVGAYLMQENGQKSKYLIDSDWIVYAADGRTQRYSDHIFRQYFEETPVELFPDIMTEAAQDRAWKEISDHFTGEWETPGPEEMKKKYFIMQRPAKDGNSDNLS